MHVVSHSYKMNDSESAKSKIDVNVHVRRLGAVAASEVVKKIHL